MLVTRKRAVLAGSGCVLLVAVLSLTWYLRRIPEPEYPDALRVSYAFVVTNTTNRAVADGKLWAIAPRAKTPSQRVAELSASLPMTMVVDTAGNQVLEFALPVIPPYGSQEVRVDALVEMAAQANRWEEPANPGLLASGPGMPIDDPRIAAATAEASSGKDDPLAGIQEWVVRSMVPVPYDAQDRGALYALLERRGDCSEFAHLVAAMARSAGRPARVVEGWVVESDAVLEAAGFHAWTEAWDGGTWRAIDAHAASVGTGSDGQRIAFRVVPNNDEAFTAGFTRFRFEGAGLTARMK